jgi:hypothetical protein
MPKAINPAHAARLDMSFGSVKRSRAGILSKSDVRGWARRIRGVTVFWRQTVARALVSNSID